MATRSLWHETPAWLRRLAVDADIYNDPDIAAMVEAARRGDEAAVEACRRMAGRR